MKKKLNLKREMLAELATDDLSAIVGGGESQSCPPGYTATCGCTATATATVTSGGISNNCTNVTGVLLGGGC
jgi:hypothetical protein